MAALPPIRTSKDHKLRLGDDGVFVVAGEGMIRQPSWIPGSVDRRA